MRKDTVRNMETERWCLKAFLRIPKKGNNVKCSGGQGIRKPGFAGHAGYSVTGGTLPVTSPGHSKTLPGCFWVSTIRWTSASLCSCPHPCLQLPILSSISFPPPSLFFICGRWSYGCQILTPPPVSKLATWFFKSSHQRQCVSFFTLWLWAWRCNFDQQDFGRDDAKTVASNVLTWLDLLSCAFAVATRRTCPRCPSGSQRMRHVRSRPEVSWRHGAQPTRALSRAAELLWLHEREINALSKCFNKCF